MKRLIALLAAMVAVWSAAGCSHTCKDVPMVSTSGLTKQDCL